MKTCLLLFAAAVACFIAGRMVGQTSESPVAVSITAPLGGQVISESGTVLITADSFSAAAPIQRIEFYKDGVLMGVKTVLPRRPEMLKLTP